MCAFFMRIQGADYYYPGFSLATMISRSNIPNFFLPGTHLLHLGRVWRLPKDIGAVAGVRTSHLVINNPGTYPPYIPRTYWWQSIPKGGTPMKLQFCGGIIDSTNVWCRATKKNINLGHCYAFASRSIPRILWAEKINIL